MDNKNSISVAWKKISSIDWKLLAFLILFLNVKLIIKAAAILLIYILRPDFKFGFRIKNSRLPLFYLLVIAIAIFNWLISGLIINFNYDLVLSAGIVFWVLCILAIHQIKLSIERNDPEIIHRTILVFFVLNALVSLAVYAGIIIETGHINPYKYQGNFQKYFIGTGDYIKGVTLDSSTTNAVLNAFGVIYFLLRKKNAMVLLCMLVLLLTGSNTTNLLLCATLLFIFIFQSTKEIKSVIVICLLMLVVFFSKVSPQNNAYISNAWKRLTNQTPVLYVPDKLLVRITERPDSLLNSEEKKEKIAQLSLDSVNNVMLESEKSMSLGKTNTEHRINFIKKPTIPKDSIHTPKFQHKNDTNAIEKDLIKFIAEHPAVTPLVVSKKTRLSLPGKIIALRQTVNYFKHNPLKLITGTGVGNFASKLAFRATSMKVAGGYPAKYAYVNNDFRANHLDLYLYYFTNKDDYHSIANTPNSTYDQLISEYGLAGLVSFIIFYAGFFTRQIKRGMYAIPLLLFMLGIFFIEYWFEQLSIVVFFEVLMLLNIKETLTNKVNENN